MLCSKVLETIVRNCSSFRLRSNNPDQIFNVRKIRHASVEDTRLLGVQGLPPPKKLKFEIKLLETHNCKSYHQHATFYHLKSFTYDPIISDGPFWLLGGRRGGGGAPRRLPLRSDLETRRLGNFKIHK